MVDRGTNTCLNIFERKRTKVESNLPWDNFLWLCSHPPGVVLGGQVCMRPGLLLKGDPGRLGGGGVGGPETATSSCGDAARTCPPYWGSGCWHCHPWLGDPWSNCDGLKEFTFTPFHFASICIDSHRFASNCIELHRFASIPRNVCFV